MRTVILSAPGREHITAAMLEALSLQNPSESWQLFAASGKDAIADFWAMLRAFAPYGDDLLALEDDIVTARNFLRYAARWRSKFLTSFFFMCGGQLAAGRPESPMTFGFSQALWFPAWLLQQLASMTPPAARFQDDALGTALAQLGEPVVYHRSLVQHVGGVSVAQPGRVLGGRTAPDFVGEDFDCMTLLDL